MIDTKNIAVPNIPHVYIIYNDVNSKVYVGSTICGKNRIVSHISLLKRNKHHSKHLQHAWNKYGSDKFHFMIVGCTIDKNKILDLEQKTLDWCKAYDSRYGYNINKTAGSRLGTPVSNEYRVNMSRLKGGRPFISTETGRRFETIVEASNYTGMSESHIRRNLRNQVSYPAKFSYITNG